MTRNSNLKIAENAILSVEESLSKVFKKGQSGFPEIRKYFDNF